MLNRDFSEEQGKYSLAEKIYQALRADILAGTFKDQEELKENALAKNYGVSRTPVREAIRQLALEGLVDTIPNRGAYVHNIHTKDVADVYAIRSQIEGLAARWAVENISVEQIEGMDEVLYMSAYYRKKGNWEQVYICDNRFHELMYAASGSHMLEHMLRMFHEYIQQARKMALRDEKRAEKSFEEHGAILEAIKKRDADEAARLAAQHIENAMSVWKMHMIDPKDR